MKGKESRKVIDIKSLPAQDEQITHSIVIEAEKYQVVIAELNMRLWEIYDILSLINKASLMTLYLLYLHHELYVKAYMDINTMKNVYEAKKYGHDISYLLSMVPTIAGIQRKTIEDDCMIISTLAPEIRGIQCYPYFRYNLPRYCLDPQYTNIFLCDLKRNAHIIERMRRNTLEKFYLGDLYDQ